MNINLAELVQLRQVRPGRWETTILGKVEQFDAHNKRVALSCVRVKLACMPGRKRFVALGLIVPEEMPAQ